MLELGLDLHEGQREFRALVAAEPRQWSLVAIFPAGKLLLAVAHLDMAQNGRFGRIPSRDVNAKLPQANLSFFECRHQ